MQELEGFLELAGIAGVFVGFGALIAVRSGGPSEPEEVAPMRAMVSLGVLAVVAALAPVTVGRFDLDEHQIWALSSVLALVGVFVMIASMARTPEWRASWRTEMQTPRSRWLTAVAGVAYVLLMAALLLTPVVIILGPAPELEPGLYFAYVVVILIAAAWSLLGLVFAQRRPATA